jgi:hypothetical protein
MLNMGFMNVIPAFFGGMPLCHGAGGLAGQYYPVSCGQLGSG